MEVICIEEKAFYQLMETVIRFVREQVTEKEKWITPEETMRLLGITSKTTLWKYRTTGRIRYSQPDKRVIMYDRTSIDAFFEKHAMEPF